MGIINLPKIRRLQENLIVSLSLNTNKQLCSTHSQANYAKMSCADMVIVFSGFRDDGLKAQIEEAGGKVATSLVKAATHLLVKKDGKASKKVDEAKEKGMEIVFLDDFIEEHEFELSEKKPKEPKAAKKASDDEAEAPAPAKKAAPKKAAKSALSDVSDLKLLTAVVNAVGTKMGIDEAIAAMEELKLRLLA